MMREDDYHAPQWQEAMGHLMNDVRADEVEHAVNLALLESDIKMEDD
jgi:hypothetical protein